MTMQFHVLGAPKPQGSKRHIGRGVMIESCKALRPWRDSVAGAAREAMQRQGWQTASGAVELTLGFGFRKPKSAKRTYPTVKPDIDKLERAVLDAMKTAGVYTDDAVVVEVSKSKYYCTAEQPEGLAVVVRRMEAE